ncbi:hypothetical protein K9N50_12825 [bacterium]|nr:hypothetical protein [bacterium]
MKRIPPLHPFLFAFFSIIFLYTNNISEMSAADIPAPALVVIAMTFLIWLVLTKILHDPVRAGVLTTVLLLLFFLYGYLYDALKYTYIGGIRIGRHRYLLPVYFILFVLFLFRGVKTKHVSILASFFNVSTTTLVALSIISLITYQINQGSISIHNSELEAKASMTKADSTSVFPDIYYIIPDGYANELTLGKYYGFDNSEFIDFLSDKGFYIASESASNFAHTRLSLASSLNMEYINDVATAIIKKEVKEEVLSKITRQSNVTEFLKSIGYKFVLIRSGSGPTDRNRHADIVIRCTAINEFIRVLIHTSILSIVEKYFYLPNQHRKMLYTTFNRLKEIPEINGHKFTLCHVLMPHPPFVFDAEGNSVNPDDMALSLNIWQPRESYVGQIRYCNKLLESAVEEILAESKQPPVIIIQGDHGPASMDEWDNPSEDFILERMMILNAYYIPTSDSVGLYPTISPVNSFRVLFNEYFDAEMEVLEDRSYMSHVYKPYNLTEATPVIRRFLSESAEQEF